jgi:hypothetical protein
VASAVDQGRSVAVAVADAASSFFSVEDIPAYRNYFPL